MRKALNIICSVCILLIFTCLVANGQSINEGMVHTTDGQIVGGAKLKVDGREYISNAEGKFILQNYDLGRQPKEISSLKQGLEVASFVVVGNTLQVTMRKPQYNEVYGQVVDNNNIPLSNLNVSISLAGKLISAKTNIEGKFKLKTPSGFRPSEDTRFIIEDSNILKTAFLFQGSYNYLFKVKKQPTYLVLGKKFYVKVNNASGRSLSGVPVVLGDQTYRTRNGAVTPTLKNYGDRLVFTAHEVIKIDSVENRNLLIATVRQIEGVDFTEEIQPTKVDTVVVLAQESSVALQDVEALKNAFNQSQAINERVKSLQDRLEGGKISDDERKVIMDALVSLNTQMEDSERALMKSRAEMKSRLDSMIIEFGDAKSKASKLEAIRIQSELENQRVKEETQRQLYLFSGIGAVLLIFLGFTINIARQFRKQRNQIGTQKQDLEHLNVNLKEKNEQITDSIRAAELIQEAILPVAAHIQATFSENFILFRPKDIVSGDFYWFKKIVNENGKIVNYIASIDCTGHGVPGAFMSMIGNTLLNEIINKEGVSETNEILELLDQGVIAALKQDTTNSDEGMDVCFCKMIYNEDDTIDLQYTGAKRPLFIFMESSNELLKIDGTPRSIGGRQQSRSGRRKRAKKPFEAHNFVLKKGSEVYLSSDGLVDQNGKTAEGEEKPKFGTKKLLETLKDIHCQSMAKQGETFNKLLDEHKEYAEQRDDITLIGLRL